MTDSIYENCGVLEVVEGESMNILDGTECLIPPAQVELLCTYHNNDGEHGTDNVIVEVVAGDEHRYIAVVESMPKVWGGAEDLIDDCVMFKPADVCRVVREC